MNLMLILLQQLRTLPSTGELRENILDVATGLGFNARAWPASSTQRTFIEIFARAYGLVVGGVTKIAEGGYLDLAEDDWLHLKSDSDYDHQVNLAVATQGMLEFVSAPLAPPHTITADDLVASTESDITFRNKNPDPVTLNPGQTVTVLFEAEVAGAGGNVAPNTITNLKTALAGVTINNPAFPGSATWITRDGADQETDEQLRTRCRTKWATLGLGPTGAYVHFARQASPSVKRVFVDDTNPRGAGTFDVYVAGDSGEVSPTVVSEVDKYLNGSADGVLRVQKGTDCRVATATKRAVPVSASVYVLKDFDTPEMRAAVERAVVAYFKVLPIGGQQLVDGGPGFVLVSALGSAMIVSAAGVQNVALSSLDRDLQLGHTEVAVPEPITLNFVQV